MTGQRSSLQGVHSTHPRAWRHPNDLRYSSDHVVTCTEGMVATGVTAQSRREIVRLDVGDSRDEVFWRGFVTGLKNRGLRGVRLVISDQHAGLVAAIARTMQGSSHICVGAGARSVGGGVRPLLLVVGRMTRPQLGSLDAVDGLGSHVMS